MRATPYLGEMALWPKKKILVGWSLCDGTILSTARNNALFGLLGTQYAGDGATAFALPDLRGIVLVGAGIKAGSSNQVGATGEVKTAKLTETQLPVHNHRSGVTDEVAK